MTYGLSMSMHKLVELIPNAGSSSPAKKRPSTGLSENNSNRRWDAIQVLRWLLGMSSFIPLSWCSSMLRDVFAAGAMACPMSSSQTVLKAICVD
jgi:hypothetical protein